MHQLWRALVGHGRAQGSAHGVGQGLFALSAGLRTQGKQGPEEA